jgi:2-hydroxymuconate-semialdehyde hydrolase
MRISVIARVFPSSTVRRMQKVVDAYADVHGISTHYLEAGVGRNVVLLHSGEYGGSAELCWEKMLPTLAERFHVIAPDWLGFGNTDKLYDFAGGTRRRLWHMTEFLAAKRVERAVFIGASMGGSVLARVAAQDSPPWQMEALVLISGGGFAPLNEHRQILLEYDGSPSAMRKIMKAILHDAEWAVSDDAYIARRVGVSAQPGAWECTSAARLKNPQLPARSEFGNADTTPYELIRQPTLVIAGAEDKLRLPGYATELATRIPAARAIVYEQCGHMPGLEFPARTAADVIDFIDEIDRANAIAPESTVTLLPEKRASGRQTTTVKGRA